MSELIERSAADIAAHVNAKQAGALEIAEATLARVRAVGFARANAFRWQACRSRSKTTCA
jgi:Asp-tRNA(Asn)/Glu-tRNA(Gln) amidotransferase A subunit family amidase